MNDKFIVCNNCGAKCNIQDAYCKSCSQTLPDFDDLNEQVIDGIENSQLKSYIEKKSDYYIKNFAKKNSKWFMQLNFAALFFGPTWFFYRKMYKIAMLYAVVSILLSSILTVTLPLIFKGDVERYYTAKQSYIDYKNSGKDTYIYRDPPYASQAIGKHPDYQKVYDDLDNAQNKIRLIDFFINVPIFIIDVLFRLFANSIYKNHIKLNIHCNNGGVSMKKAIGGLFLVNLITVFVALLLSQVSVVSEFTEATQTLYNWI